MVGAPFLLDLNGDVGEGVGDDAQLLPLLTSANIACGGHAGDDATMRATLAVAVPAGVAVGAHPGHEERATFGRVERPIAPAELAALITRQFERLAAHAAHAGVALAHVKLHGALYHQVGRDAALAAAAVAAIARLDRTLRVVGAPNSALALATQAAGMRFVGEAFADRTYRRDGTLTPRSEPGALIDDEERAVAQVLSLVQRGVVRAQDGHEVALRAETICLHGDGPHALAFARRLRRELLTAGVTLRAVAR